MKTDIVYSRKSDEWATPQALFDQLDKEFHFTLDPCASDANHKCETFFTKEDDGLSKKWGGVAFCNPPYSRIAKWVQKAFEEAKDGTTVIMLIPSRTDTRWFHDYIYGKHEIRFIKGRIKFEGAKYNAPFPSMVVVMRGD